MTIGVIGNSVQLEILSSKMEISMRNSITRYDSIEVLPAHTDIVFDFEMSRTDETIQQLFQKTSYLFLNDIIRPLNTSNNLISRFNGWTTFFERPVLEICDISPDKRNELILKKLGIHFITSTNTIGLISAKVVAMIINEAYFALEEGVSTKEEIDIAMKLGTNYPLGPFEWCEKIGVQKIIDLLNALMKHNNLYQPSKRILQEIQ